MKMGNGYRARRAFSMDRRACLFQGPERRGSSFFTALSRLQGSSKSLIDGCMSCGLRKPNQIQLLIRRLSTSTPNQRSRPGRRSSRNVVLSWTIILMCMVIRWVDGWMDHGMVGHWLVPRWTVARGSFGSQAMGTGICLFHLFHH